MIESAGVGYDCLFPKQRRAQGFGTQSHIANPHPCVDSRSVSQRPDGVWQTTFEILYLSGDGSWGRR